MNVQLYPPGKGGVVHSLTSEYWTGTVSAYLNEDGALIDVELPRGTVRRGKPLWNNIQRRARPYFLAERDKCPLRAQTNAMRWAM